MTVRVDAQVYWRLLEVARQFSDAKGDERCELADLRVDILRSKRANILFAQILFAIGTLPMRCSLPPRALYPRFWLGSELRPPFSTASGMD